MTILVDHQILEAVEKGWIKIEPFDDKLVNPASLDVRLGKDFYEVHTANGFHAVDPTNPESFKTVKVLDEGRYILQPGCMVLAPLLEDITLPDFICAQIKGKSSLGRIGLDNSSLAGFVDPGWSGVLTIELFNHNSFPIRLNPQMKIGQIVFHETEPVGQSYEKTGRYQRQDPGQGSKGVT